MLRILSFAILFSFGLYLISCSKDPELTATHDTTPYNLSYGALPAPRPACR